MPRRKNRIYVNTSRKPAQARLNQQAVRRVLGVEKKYYDTFLDANALSNPTDASGGEEDPATVLCLNGVQQGDGEERRDGKQIRMDSLFIQGRVLALGKTTLTALSNSCKVYIAVILDTQTNETQLSSEDVFDNPSGVTGLAADPWRNLQTSKRFRILGSKRLTLQPMAAAGQGAVATVVQGGVEKTFKFNIKLKGMQVNFSSINEGVGAIVDNSIHVIGYASSTSITPLLTYNSRLRFFG